MLRLRMGRTLAGRPAGRSLLLVLTVLALGCSGGSSPTGPTPAGSNCIFPEPPPGFPDANATFTPAAAPASSITLQPSANCSDLLILELRATNVTDLARVQYSINVVQNVISFDNFQVGPFLSSNGTVQVTGPGGLNGDLSRPAGQAGVSGSGQIALIAWVYLAQSGSTSITLTGQAFDSNGNVIGNIGFAGGNLSFS